MNKKTGWGIWASMLALCGFAADCGLQQEGNTEQSSNTMSQPAATAPAATPIDLQPRRP